MVHLELLGRRLDDDEYLIDCGCNPRAVNEITTVYLMPGEREIKVSPDTPDDDEEVPITLNYPPPGTQSDKQVPTQSSMRRENHREAVKFRQNPRHKPT